MNESKNIRAIILKRSDHRESDSRIVLYSSELGKTNLIVRGAKKKQSKLSCHVEPITLCDIMAIKGRAGNYVGSAVSCNVFSNIKKNLAKLQLAGSAVRIIEKTTREDLPDKDIFDLICGFLENLNQEEKKGGELLLYSFVLKLLLLSGYKPELYTCVVCSVKPESNGNYFDHGKGGIVCSEHSNSAMQRLDKNGVKLLRFLISEDFTDILKLKVQEEDLRQISIFVKKYLEYRY